MPWGRSRSSAVQTKSEEGKAKMPAFDKNTFYRWNLDSAAQIINMAFVLESENEGVWSRNETAMLVEYLYWRSCQAPPPLPQTKEKESNTA